MIESPRKHFIFCIERKWPELFSVSKVVLAVVVVVAVEVYDDDHPNEKTQPNLDQSQQPHTLLRVVFKTFAVSERIALLVVFVLFSSIKNIHTWYACTCVYLNND